MLEVLRENLDGSYDWDRTSDLSIMSAALQPTELRSHALLPGWGTRIRTLGMAESESAALPLGYTPILT